MFQKIAMAVALVALSTIAFAEDERAVEDQNSSCEERCVEQEEACYARCPEEDEEGVCADACYSAADACLNRCAE